MLQDPFVPNVTDGVNDGVQPNHSKNEKARSDGPSGGCGEDHAQTSSSTNNDSECINLTHSAMSQGMRLSKGSAQLEGTNAQSDDAAEDVNVDGGRGGQKRGDRRGAALHGVGEGGAAAWGWRRWCR